MKLGRNRQTKGDDADSSGTVSPSRSQQMWFEMPTYTSPTRRRADVVTKKRHVCTPSCVEPGRFPSTLFILSFVVNTFSKEQLPREKDSDEKEKG
ncbi:hypothetical protein INR49_022475 [Caranx melampygus]|nr:hypothetical protein INR49_022475 [Caranx melampygus]